MSFLNPENRDTVDLDDIYGQSFHESNRILFLHENEPFVVNQSFYHQAALNLHICKM